MIRATAPERIHDAGNWEFFLLGDINVDLMVDTTSVFGLTDIVALFVKKARFLGFKVFFRACSLLNEVGDPPFFLHF